MEKIKKYWWLIAIVVILLILFFSSKPSSVKAPIPPKEGGGTAPSRGGTRIEGQPGGCTPITDIIWNQKKTWYWQRNGNNWGKAHQAMLDEGFCEWIN